MLNIKDKSNVGRNGNKCWLPALAGFVQHGVCVMCFTAYMKVCRSCRCFLCFSR